MATVKKGILTPAPQWWKHLRDFKRVFWKGERQAVREDLEGRLDEVDATNAIDAEIDWIEGRYCD